MLLLFIVYIDYIKKIKESKVNKYGYKIKRCKSPTWKVGRKKVDEKIKYISKSVSLPSEKWIQIEQKAQEQGITKNKLIANLIMNYLEE